MREWKISSCPLNCFDVCGFEVEVENDRVVRVEGRKDHAITKGKICGNGRMLVDRINHKDRILQPLKKVNGSFLQISWDQALDEIANRMRMIKEKYGPTAILHSYDYGSGGLLKNLEQRFFNAFGGMTEVVGSLCWGAGIAAQTYDFGEVRSHEPEDILNARNIIIWGRNVAVTNLHLYPLIQQAVGQGARLIVIDPNRNQVAKLAELHFTIAPGMDGGLALLLCKRIWEKGLADTHFIKSYTHGFEEFLDVLNKIDGPRLQSMCGIDSNTLDQLCEIISEKPTAIVLGYGMQRYANGGNTIRAIDALGAITGNIGIPGAGVNYGNKSVGASFDYDALTLPHLRKVYRTFVRATQADEILAANDPPIEMLFVTRSNPVTQVPESHKTYQAFAQIPTKVVIDMFMTDTAQMADYILPCTTVFEEEDIHYNSMWHGYINYAPAVVPPYGEAKPDLQIFTELAKRLGFGELFDYRTDEFLAMGLGKLADHGITVERLKKEYTLRLPLEEVAWADRQFKTPSGKFEFASDRAERDGLPRTAILMFPRESEEMNPELVSKYPYTLLTIHPLRSLHSQDMHLKKTMKQPHVDISGEMAKRLNITDGDRVRVYNERGSWIGIAKIKEGIHPDTLFIEEGWWKSLGANVNELTPNELSDMGKGSSQYDCKVAIEKC